jgi:hypothetical protein
VRQVTSWIMTHPDRLDPRDAVKLRDLRGGDRDLNRLVKHVRSFAVMLTGRHGDRLEEWISTVELETLTPLAGFARNLRRDFDAVRNGLTLPHSSGPVEGSINRLKMLKRQMFGRAGLDLLRIKPYRPVLHGRAGRRMDNSHGGNKGLVRVQQGSLGSGDATKRMPSRTLLVGRRRAPAVSLWPPNG